MWDGGIPFSLFFRPGHLQPGNIIAFPVCFIPSEDQNWDIAINKRRSHLSLLIDEDHPFDCYVSGQPTRPKGRTHTASFSMVRYSEQQGSRGVHTVLEIEGGGRSANTIHQTVTEPHRSSPTLSVLTN